MGRAWIVVAKREMVARLRDRSAIFLGLVIPIALASVVTLSLGRASEAVVADLILVDRDGGVVPKLFEHMIQEEPALRGVVSVVREDDLGVASAAVREGEAAAAFVVDPGFSKAVLAGKRADLRLVVDDTAPLTASLAREVARAFMAQVHANQVAVEVAVDVGGRMPRADLETLVTRGASLRLPLEIEGVGPGAAETSQLASYFGPSMAILFVFFGIQSAIRAYVGERAGGTLHRLLTAASPRSILAGKSAATFAVAVAGMLLVIGLIYTVFGVSTANPLLVVLVCIATICAMMGVCAFVATLARSDDQVTGWGLLLAFGFALIGGNFVPVWQLPGFLKGLALVTPNGWSLRAFAELRLDPVDVDVVLQSCGVLIVSGAVLAALAAARSRRAVIA